jgi:3-isopropylmalate/(R)-2-methylmalate dehydratase small subunit
MQPFTKVTGAAAPLPAENVNTDIIIRIDRLTNTNWDDTGPWAFEAWRYLPDGSENPDFVMNKDAYRGAPILIAGRNFACGSSREGAVRALAAAGFRSVIAPSFGPIFFNNCFQNGMLPVVLPGGAVAEFIAMAEAAPGAEFTVDLEAKTVTPPRGEPVAFDLDEMRRQGLLRGLDEIGLTLGRAAEIDAFQARDRAERPWIYLP